MVVSNWGLGEAERTLLCLIVSLAGLGREVGASCKQRRRRVVRVGGRGWDLSLLQLWCG